MYLKFFAILFFIIAGAVCFILPYYGYGFLLEAAVNPLYILAGVSWFLAVIGLILWGVDNGNKQTAIYHEIDRNIKDVIEDIADVDEKIALAKSQREQILAKKERLLQEWKEYDSRQGNLPTWDQQDLSKIKSAEHTHSIQATANPNIFSSSLSNQQPSSLGSEKPPLHNTNQVKDSSFEDLFSDPKIKKYKQHVETYKNKVAEYTDLVSEINEMAPEIAQSFTALNQKMQEEVKVLEQQAAQLGGHSGSSPK